MGFSSLELGYWFETCHHYLFLLVAIAIGCLFVSFRRFNIGMEGKLELYG